MFIRTFDSSTFLMNVNNNIVTIAPKKRKGNTVIGFDLDKNKKEIKLTDRVLNLRMVPKNDKVFLRRSPLKILVLDSGDSIVFQDFSLNQSSAQVRFLKLFDTGYILPESFEDLTEGDSILVYDSDADYKVCDIEELIEIENTEDEDNYSESDDGENIDKLSNYIIQDDMGLIINNIFVI